MEGGYGRVFLHVRVVERVGRMVRTLGCDATDGFLGDGRPVGGCEGEAVVRACVQRIHLQHDRLDPLALDTQVEAVDSNEPVGGGNHSRHQRHPGVVPIDEELCLRFPDALGDGGRIELVEDSSFALTLGVEDFRLADLSELLQALRCRVPHPEEEEGRVVGSSHDFGPLRWGSPLWVLLGEDLSAPGRLNHHFVHRKFVRVTGTGLRDRRGSRTLGDGQDQERQRG